MRVASNTIYGMTSSRLGRINSEMLDLNTMVTTGKKINKLDDDPLGLTRVVSLKSSISNLGQLQRNIATGRTWLEAGEQSLGAINDLVSEAKTLAISMNSGTMSEDDLKSGALEVAGILEQVMALSNTEVQGQYIYSGTKTEVKAFTLETTGGITRAVYDGNDNPFKIKTAIESDIEVGQDGSGIFNNSRFVIDDTNNKIDFMEDPAGGAAFNSGELTATIPNGEYTPDELAYVVAGSMTERSAGVKITEVTQGDASFIINDLTALSSPTGAANIDLTYSAAANRWSVADVPAGYTEGIAALPLESDDTKIALDFTGNGEADVTVNLDNPVADGYSVSFDITAAGVNAVDYNVSYNEGTEKYTIMENGGPVLDNLTMMWESGSHSDTGIGVDMGFDVASDDTGAADGTNHVSDLKAERGIFKTLIDLQAYLEDGDVAGLNRSISRLSADFNHIESFISQNGIKQLRLDIRDTVIEDLNVTYETNRSRIEDADFVETFSMFQQKYFAYQAALSSTTKILDISLLNYI